MTSFISNVVLPGTIGPESLPFIIALMVIAFAASTLHDMWKKKRGK